MKSSLLPGVYIYMQLYTSELNGLLGPTNEHDKLTKYLIGFNVTASKKYSEQKVQ